MSTLQVSVDKAAETAFRIRREEFFGYDLSVGVSYEDSNAILKIELLTFLTSSSLILAVSFGSAYQLAKSTQYRIFGLTECMNQIAKGSLSSRLPISKREDDIDALASGINEALDKLEVSVKAIRRMSANVAHDLKAPMTGVRLAIESCIEQLKDGHEVTGFLEGAIQQIDELNKTFEAILKIAEIESGILRDSFISLDLGVLVHEVHETFSPIFEEEQKTLLASAAQNILIMGDRRLILQMLINLVNNARRHTPRGTIVTMTLEACENSAVIMVSDDGPGIAERDRKRVFEHFVHLSPGGSGLGLSIVRAIVELHAATIVLRDNEPGLIAEVRFSLVSAKN